jgi:hypothetical protein
MAKLTRAIGILTKLEQHLTEQINTITTNKQLDSHGKIKAIEQQLIYLSTQKANAIEQKNNSKHTRVQDKDPRFDELKKLEATVETHNNNLLALLETYKTKAIQPENEKSTEEVKSDVEPTVEKAISEPSVPVTLAPSSPVELENVAYTTALDNLENLKKQPHPNSLDTPLNNLLSHIKNLKEKDKGCTTELTHALEATYRLMTGDLNSEAYNTHANTVQGKPSTEFKVLGGLMLALSIAVVSLGLIFFPALAVTTVAGLSIASAATSVGFFAKGMQSGLSKQMSHVSAELEQTKCTFTALGA